MRNSYEERLNNIKKELVNLGDMVITAIDESIKALRKKDVSLAQQIINNDSLINEKQRKIEETIIYTMATQQPVARELRELIACFIISVELERIADYAEGISRIVVRWDNQPHVKPLIDIPNMSELSIEMIKNSLKAFVMQDVTLAKSTWKMDDKIDQLYHQILRELITFMMEDPKIITRSTYLIWVAHNLERIADRATNICERTIFLVEGYKDDFLNPES